MVSTSVFRLLVDAQRKGLSLFQKVNDVNVVRLYDENINVVPLFPDWLWSPRSQCFYFKTK